jgi:hypothetical protein
VGVGVGVGVLLFRLKWLNPNQIEFGFVFRTLEQKNLAI